MNAAGSILAVATPAPAPTGAKWIDAQTAARRMGVSLRRVRQLAFSEWYARGQAAQRAGDNGRPSLHIRSDADKRLCLSVSPDDVTVDLGQLTGQQRVELRRRLAIYSGWVAAREAGVKAGKTERAATADYLLRLMLDDGSRVTRETLFRWHRQFRHEGQRGLLDGRWKQSDDTTAGGGDDPFADEIKRLYLDKRRRSKKFCYDYAADKGRDEGWNIPSLRSACRMLERIPVQVVALHRGGIEAYKNTVATFIERDYTSLDSNALWVADHHRFDVWVKDGGRVGRPWLSAFQDVRSRMIVGWRIFMHDPNSDAILAAFRSGCQEFGVPDGVYLDNGKDFDAEALQGCTKAQRRRCGLGPIVDSGVFGQLGVEVVHALPYNPQSKPIERFFGTVCSRFSRIFPTYCGGSPNKRPDDLEQKLKRGAATAIRDFAAAFANWLTEYHASNHEGDGMDCRSPRAVYDACLIKKSVLSAELAKLLLMKKSRPLKVGQCGVTWKGIHYGARELAGHFGKQVILRIDDQDATRVDVYSFPAEKFIASVSANQKMPFKTDSQAVREAIAEQRRDRRAYRDYHANRPRPSEPLEDRLANRAARLRQEQAGQPALGAGASIVPVRSHLEGELPKIRAAREVQSEGSGEWFARLGSRIRQQHQAPASRDPLLDYQSKSFTEEEREDTEVFRMAVGAEVATPPTTDALMAWMQRRRAAQPSESDL